MKSDYESKWRSLQIHALLAVQLLTRIPSHLDTARSGRRALKVLIDRKAGMSAAPNQIAPKFINESYMATRTVMRRNSDIYLLLDIHVMEYFKCSIVLNLKATPLCIVQCILKRLLA